MPKKKMPKGHNLAYTPDKPIPGPKHALAKAGVPQSAVDMPMHKKGGLRGTTRSKQPAPYSAKGK